MATGLAGHESLETVSVGSFPPELAAVGATVQFGANPPATIVAANGGGGIVELWLSEPITEGGESAPLWVWVPTYTYAIKLNALVLPSTPALAYVAGRAIGLPVDETAIWPFTTSTIAVLAADQSVIELAEPVEYGAPEKFWRWSSGWFYWASAGAGSQPSRGAILTSDGALTGTVEIDGAAYSVLPAGDNARAVWLAEPAAATLDGAPVRTALAGDYVATLGSHNLLVPPNGPASDVPLSGGQVVALNGANYTIDSIHGGFALRPASVLTINATGVATLPAPPVTPITGTAIRLPRP